MDKQEDLDLLEQLVGNLLTLLHYNWEEDTNLKDTPKRVAKLWLKELSPKGLDEPKITVFPEKHSQMVIVAGHTVWTRCPHHLERIKMRVSIGYIQGDSHLVIGASKLPRVADFFAQGMVLQESYTDKVVSFLYDKLQAKGVGVHVVGKHHCMHARGVETDGVMVTTALKGIFQEDGVKNEFLREVHFKPWNL